MAFKAAQRGTWSYVAAASAGKGMDMYVKIWRAKYCQADLHRSPDMPLTSIFQGPPRGQLASFWDCIMIFRFSLDWSDYGHMSWTILYGVVCTAMAYGLVRSACHNIPWTGIAVFLIDSIGKVIDSLWQVALLSYGCLYSLSLGIWMSIADGWAAIVSYIRSTLRTFIGLPPVDGFQHPAHPQVPPQYGIPPPIFD
ncbi:hypothetical protein EDD15DRAFT_2359210 [Pisolithus albus]|nr:hypothetical protein EDD15DRAFT_2359210 [Pisolithus albus]